MRRISVVILLLFIVMSIIWLFVDLLMVVKTPLGRRNHWVLEFPVIFLIGFDRKKISLKEVLGIFLAIFFYIIGFPIVLCLFFGGNVFLVLTLSIFYGLNLSGLFTSVYGIGCRLGARRLEDSS